MTYLGMCFTYPKFDSPNAFDLADAFDLTDAFDLHPRAKRGYPPSSYSEARERRSREPRTLRSMVT
ncbi:hypothetical protein JB92DRAFT_3118069 [Gautieria morchelliformis]|nr:hypothetical protein JB92DRAFT_3118069 [Gautieria morchelliformis]